jgi:hypothetical protein
MTYGELGQTCQEIADLVRMLSVTEEGEVRDRIKNEINAKALTLDGVFSATPAQ